MIVGVPTCYLRNQIIGLVAGISSGIQCGDCHVTCGFPLRVALWHLPSMITFFVLVLIRMIFTISFSLGKAFLKAVWLYFIIEHSTVSPASLPPFFPPLFHLFKMLRYSAFFFLLFWTVLFKKLGRKLQFHVCYTNKHKKAYYYLTGVWVILFSICENISIHDILRFRKCDESEHRTLSTLFMKVQLTVLMIRNVLTDVKCLMLIELGILLFHVGLTCL